MGDMMDVLLSSQGDNSRDRALGDMMGGAIQVKKEDILKKVGKIPSNIGHFRKQIKKTINLHFPSDKTTKQTFTS
jgi:hypothetical protein